MSIEKNTKNTLLHEDGGFTTTLNETTNAIRHTGALGVYHYLASKPPLWQICKLELMRHFDCGRKHIDTCFKYLQKIGALEISAVRNKKGQFDGWETTLKRTINKQSVNSNQNTENRQSGDSTRIPVFHNLDNPQSGKGAPIKEITTTNNNIIKKTNKPVSVFSCFETLKAHLLLILAKRKLIFDDDLIAQILFYVGEERHYDAVVKKFNIALKLIATKKWNIPNGYQGITSKSIAEKEKKHAIEKQTRMQEEARAARAIVQAVKTGSRTPLKDMLKNYQEGKDANQGRMQEDIKQVRV